jgi:hypothetical protein
MAYPPICSQRLFARDNTLKWQMGELMTFADKLVQTPRREKSGETGYERYDYQASWGLALIFESHNDL